MEKLEVGEYIRTKDGIIAKITDIVKEYCIDCDNDVFDAGNSAMMEIPWKHIKEYVIKHSKNLIDLIEIGDIVNGYRILEMVNSIYKKSKWILIYKNEREKYERWIYIKEYDGKIHTQDDIKTILTKEQYMQNCYKVDK